jgi:hypothetical protein
MPEFNPLPENAEPHGSPTRREFLATTSGAVIAGVLLPKAMRLNPRRLLGP